jgi:predicted PhzF superfamily epimerase YddE/YHI9
MPIAEYRYRIVNVFADERFAGNPPAVFEGARGMDKAGKLFVAGRAIALGRGSAAL